MNRKILEILNFLFLDMTAFTVVLFLGAFLTDMFFGKQVMEGYVISTSIWNIRLILEYFYDSEDDDDDFDNGVNWEDRLT